MEEKRKKICVYAICKNESKFVDRWLSSLSSESDYIVVLDTGSTDGTYELLSNDSRVTHVEQEIIEPWRFDTARNESMKLIPKDTDICVIADFDHIFRPGWGDELRHLFDLGYQEIYGDIIDYDENNNEIKRFLSKNVHPNSPEWYWERPIHEGISYHGKEQIKTIVLDKFVIEHHPDRTKSRDGYLNLLEKEYEENHQDPMCAIYYGCELSFHGKDEEALAVFLRANEECDYSSCPEIGYQMQLNIALSYYDKGIAEKDNPVIEATHLVHALEYANAAEKYGIITRRLYMTQAKILIAMQSYNKTIKAIEVMHKALGVKYHDLSWVDTDDYFEGAVEDELALTYYKIENYYNAIIYGSLALYFKPNDKRLQNNMKYYIEAFLNKKEDIRNG